MAHWMEWIKEMSPDTVIQSSKRTFYGTKMVVQLHFYFFIIVDFCCILDCSRQCAIVGNDDKYKNRTDNHIVKYVLFSTENYVCLICCCWKLTKRNALHSSIKVLDVWSYRYTKHPKHQHTALFNVSVAQDNKFIGILSLFSRLRNCKHTSSVYFVSWILLRSCSCHIWSHFVNMHSDGWAEILLCIMSRTTV